MDVSVNVPAVGENLITCYLDQVFHAVICIAFIEN